MAGESFQPFLAPVDKPAAQPLDQVPFQAHVELLRWFLTHRDGIVEKAQGLLKAERKPAHYLQDTPLLSRQLEDCFFTPAALVDYPLALKRQLDDAHAASGFKPRETPGLHNDLIDAAQMMVRGFRLWQETRWPGNHGRTRYAHTLFNVYLLRRLMLLSMRLWDSGPTHAGERLAQIQGVLDELWRTTPAEQPIFVRDARWLIPLAQSPTTDDLAGYFEVAERVAETLTEADRIEIHKASVRMAGGHLRSQLRHVSSQKGVPLDDHDLVLSTRKSNALDLATLIQGLVPLLEAYEHAVQGGDGENRRDLADAILQGLSPDPELFLNRLDLLGPYSMIEHLFITTDDDGQAIHTPTGERHLRLLREYETRIRRSAPLLLQDCRAFEPVAGTYSPYGVLYGFSSGLLEHMALKSAHTGAATPFSLEDVFTRGDADKLAWVSGWRELPHIPREVAKQFEYPQAFAAAIFQRIEGALHGCVVAREANAALRSGRLFLLPGDEPSVESRPSPLPDLPVQYILSSDARAVASHEAAACDRMQLLHSRFEGEFVVSYETAGGWMAISKDILTDVLGAGRDARLAGLPRAAAAVLKLMCPRFVVLQENDD